MSSKLLPCVTAETSVRAAIATLDRGGMGIVLVTSVDQELLATITDGDIRRAMLDGLSLEVPVARLVERKAGTEVEYPVVAPHDSSREELLQLMTTHKIRQIPLLNRCGQVVDLAILDELVPSGKLMAPNVSAVIMAGGFGQRLQPLTNDAPKPMLPVGDRPLMELVVDRLREAGVRRIDVSTYYMPHKIVDHFGNGEKFGVDLQYISEDRPLGTAGALSLLSPPQEPLLVMNGDILTQVDFRALIEFHHKHAAALTIAVRRYEVQVPYGVVEHEGAAVRKLAEKPTFDFLVNAGIYVVSPAAWHEIPKNERFDMTDLISRLLEQKKTVASFPIHEYWLDIGQMNDYQQAQRDVSNGRFAARAA